MHRISTIPGGDLNLGTPLVFLSQSPSPIVFITAADTDIQTIAAATPRLPDNFPQIRLANLLQLQQQIVIDTYSEQVLEYAEVIVLRLLGGRSYWAYGLEVVQDIVQRRGTNLIVMPGDDGIDLELISQSTLPVEVVNQILLYFREGGVENHLNALKFIANSCLGTAFGWEPPESVPKVGLYPVQVNHSYPPVGIIFYRAHYLAGNIKVIHALCEVLIKQYITPVPVFVSSLRDGEVQRELVQLLNSSGKVLAILNTTSFSLACLDGAAPQVDLWQGLNVPVFQVIFSGDTVEGWQLKTRGLSPRDIAMNVALPEVDGRIITRAVSFKAVAKRDGELETDIMVYEPEGDRLKFVSELAANWVRLATKAPLQKRVALILANYPSRNGRIANGVGLDTPASCVEIIKAMSLAGYVVEPIPTDGDELIKWLTQGVTNDPETQHWHPVKQSLSTEDYHQYFSRLPNSVQEEVNQTWGLADKQECFPIAGVGLGNVFIGIQPSRGYDLDAHNPQVVPSHNYLAFYHWLRTDFKADAIVHVGKHGNLEWLPGKSLALSATCYPEIALGPIPHFYPFIVNDPGEGSQAKRRAHAVILDHLTPPITRAELYGSLQEIENLVDEYYEAETLDPQRLPMLSDRLRQLILQENLHQELKINTPNDSLPDLNLLSGYLCELKEQSIRDGLHILGQTPQGEQLRDLILSIARIPTNSTLGHTQGITQHLAAEWGLQLDPLTTELATPLSPEDQEILSTKSPQPCRIVGDAVELLETEAAHLIEKLLNQQTPIPDYHWIQNQLLPALQQTPSEITNLLAGLAGKYIPSAPAGAPTRGRPEVLPTGKNFYSVDIRALPTETAWDIGRKAAENLIENYTQEKGEYPRTLGLSLWGTATMRTGGDDIAQALALLGVQPVWDTTARRVIDFEILPLTILGRPRVDVTLRVSGFFRDAFPNLIELFEEAVTAVAALEEPPESNPLAAQVNQDIDYWLEQGHPTATAISQSLYRVFSSQPGAYGAGIQGLIDNQNWNTREDLADAYINYSCYAYTATQGGIAAADAFKRRLGEMQIVLHNQDNREHDLLDSDDYYQFQGGLTAAVGSVRGENPEVYFGDHSLPACPRVRTLQAEIARVYRSRVINPKWIKGMMRHGYKGAFEMAATVDFLFGYDATAGCVEDYIYEGVAKAFLLDSTVQSFIQNKNPWALRDIAERLLEANQRGLWQDGFNTVEGMQMLESLRNLAREAEGIIEQQ